MPKPTTVWVGFSDGKPHVFVSNPGWTPRRKAVAVYPSERDAIEDDYVDVRPMELRPVRVDLKLKRRTR